jgi:hypothetical protein
MMRRELALGGQAAKGLSRFGEPARALPRAADRRAVLSAPIVACTLLP